MDLETRLAALVPSPGRVDRDAILFAAGRRETAARAGAGMHAHRAPPSVDVVSRRVLRIWQTVAAAALILAGVCALGWSTARSGTEPGSSSPSNEGTPVAEKTPLPPGSATSATRDDAPPSVPRGPAESGTALAQHDAGPTAPGLSDDEAAGAMSFGRWRRNWIRSVDGSVLANLDTAPASSGTRVPDEPLPPSAGPAANSYLKLRAAAFDL